MATSSIFAKIRIDDPEKVEAFIDALEKSENEPKRRPLMPAKPSVTNINEIKKFMAKRFPEV